ncbi:MAG: phosphoglycolate phosphatase [Candidatus Pseudothioglobus sp.]|jgi:phosphoglycolate phosphatase
MNTAASMSTDVQGYIFDLDGTLLNTLESLANCYNRVLLQLGHPPHPVDAYRYFIGDGARRCIERCLPTNAKSDTQVDAALALQQADYQASWQHDAQPYPGIVAMLELLSQRGLPLTVLSNKDHEFTLACVEYFFPTITFQQIVGFSTGVPHKPDPTGAQTIAQTLDIPVASIVFVGDTAMDMQTAITCGMTAVGVLWGFRDAAELLDAGAHHLIRQPHNLLD